MTTRHDGRKLGAEKHEPLTLAKPHCCSQLDGCVILPRNIILRKVRRYFRRNEGLARDRYNWASSTAQNHVQK